MLGVYIVEKPFAGHSEGEKVELDSDVAAALAGYVREATDEDAGDGTEDDTVPAEAELVNNAVATLSRNIEDSIARVVARTATTKANVPSVKVPAQVKEPVFKCLGDLALAAYKAKTMRDTTSRNRLGAYQLEQKTAPLGNATTTNALGQYTVREEWFKEIWDKQKDYPKLLEKTERMQITGNTLHIPVVNETSLADGSRNSGLLSYWVAEAQAITASNMQFTTVPAVLNANVTLSYVTQQLLQFSNLESFDKFLTKKVGMELIWQENESVCNGAGTTQPKGLLNQAALITIATSSGAHTYTYIDLMAMYRAMYPPSRNNAVWLVNPEGRDVFERLQFVDTSGTGAHFPAAGYSYNAYDEFPLRFKGRPVIEVMNLKQLGAKGDIYFADLSQLVTVENGQIFFDVSEAPGFTSLQTAFRWYRFYDIQSPWTAALTSVDGNYSYSPFVTLANRGT